ncbi:MAG: thioredoxin family protein [Armatimonadetes bacterium]|nr:thioredoxin family protein [Armatimonadota bacterium]
MRRLFLGILIVALTGGIARAQGLQSPGFPVEVHTDFTRVPVGRTFNMGVAVRIQPPWHIQAHKSALFATQLDLKAPEGLTIKKIDYPEGEKKRFGGSDTVQDVYQGAPVIVARVEVAPSARPGPARISGSLAYQACDDRGVCKLPRTMEIPAVTVEVVAPGEAPHASGWVLPAPGSLPTKSGSLPASTLRSGSTPLGGAMDIEQLFRERGLTLGLGVVFLLGLMLNLTPCVFPIIPVTISYFGTQAQGKRGKTFRLALFYVLGMVLMYSALGVIAASTGRVFGFAASSPAVTIGIAIIIVALALSNFGLYELRPPSFLTSKTQARSGYIGALLMGIMVGILAAPCSGPVVLALAAFTSHKAQPLIGFGLFFVLALGLGLPYLVLGSFSGLVSALPRSGGWMETVKRILGVVMIFAALFFLQSGAVLPRDVMAALMAGFWIAAGFYLIFGDPELREMAGTHRFKAILGLVAVLWGVYSLVEVGQRADRLGGQVADLSAQLHDIAQTGGKVDLERLPAVWPPVTLAKLEQAKQSGAPVALDFGAEWCVKCIELEEKTFPHPAVRAELQRFRYFKVDMTRQPPAPEIQQLAARYKVQGLPVVIFLGPDGQERTDVRLVDFEGPQQFLQRLKQVPGGSPP